MKKDLIVIEYATMSITANFEAAEKHLKKELEKYDVVVTEDTIKGCKALSTELNKIASEIDTKRKAELKIMTAPIRDFDGKMKSLVTLCKDGRTKLTEQMKVFDDQRLKEVEKLLTERREALWRHHEIDEKFHSAEFDDFILQGSMTAKGNLTAKTQAELAHRIQADKSKQLLIEKRLLVLENECYKAGLTTPLVKENVKGFLYAEDNSYSGALARLIAAELQRQEDSEELMRKKLIKEAEVVAEAAEHPVIVETEKLTDGFIEPGIASTTDPATKAAMLAENDTFPEVDVLHTYGCSVGKTDTFPEVLKDTFNAVEIPAARVTADPVITENEFRSDAVPAGKVTYVIHGAFEVTVPETVSGERVAGLIEKAIIKAGIKSLKKINVAAVIKP